MYVPKNLNSSTFLKRLLFRHKSIWILLHLLTLRMCIATVLSIQNWNPVRAVHVLILLSATCNYLIAVTIRFDLKSIAKLAWHPRQAFPNIINSNEETCAAKHTVLRYARCYPVLFRVNIVYSDCNAPICQKILDEVYKVSFYPARRYFSNILRGHAVSYAFFRSTARICYLLVTASLSIVSNSITLLLNLNHLKRAWILVTLFPFSKYHINLMLIFFLVPCTHNCLTI